MKPIAAILVFLCGCSAPLSTVEQTQKPPVKTAQTPKARVERLTAMEVLPPKPWLVWTQPPDPLGLPVVNDVESRTNLLADRWTCIASNLMVQFWPIKKDKPAEFFRVGARRP